MQMSAQLTLIYAPIDKELIDMMFVESFGDSSSSPIRTVLCALLTKDDLTWQLVTLHLLQEFASHGGSRLIAETSQDKALIAHQNKTKTKGHANSSGNGVECWYCAK